MNRVPQVSSSTHALEVEVVPAADWKARKHVWAYLCEASPFTSFFLTVDWVDAWLEVFGDQLHPDILIFRSAESPVAICLLVSKCQSWRGVPLQRIYLNTAGEPESDETCIEFNSVVCLPGWEEAVADALSKELLRREWDEFVIPGCLPGPILDALCSSITGKRLVHTIRPSPYVNLNSLRERGLTFEQVLGPATRARLRRSLRHYAEFGALTTELARDMPSALDALDELAALHQSAWAQRGRPGVFSSKAFVAFHRHLVREALPKGHIQLLTISAGRQRIGLLYNFVYRGKVYYYQSGLCYSDDKRLSPGVVCFACAIKHCLENDFAEFDYLAGEQPYKQSLSTDTRTLDWVVFQRPTIKLHLINFLRGLRSRRFTTSRTG